MKLQRFDNLILLRTRFRKLQRCDSLIGRVNYDTFSKITAFQRYNCSRQLHLYILL